MDLRVDVTGSQPSLSHVAVSMNGHHLDKIVSDAWTDTHRDTEVFLTQKAILSHSFLSGSQMNKV